MSQWRLRNVILRGRFLLSDLQKKDATMSSTETELPKHQIIEPIKQQIIPVVDTHPELPIDPDVVRPGSYKWPPHFTPTLLGVVFIGGCIGTLARYWVTTEIPVGTNSWPTATFFVNLLGAFSLGVLLEVLSQFGRDERGLRLLRLGLGTGFLGAFTTYSTFVVETNMLLREDSIVLAFSYVAASIIGGLMMSALGIKLAIVHYDLKAVQ